MFISLHQLLSICVGPLLKDEQVLYSRLDLNENGCSTSRHSGSEQTSGSLQQIRDEEEVWRYINYITYSDDHFLVYDIYQVNMLEHLVND